MTRSGKTPPTAPDNLKVELQEALVELAPKNVLGGWDGKYVGVVFNRYRDRNLDGYRVVRGSLLGGSVKWKVVLAGTKVGSTAFGAGSASDEEAFQDDDE